MVELFASIEELIVEAREGRPFLLVDDADRENEGDLVIPACFATPKMINFMMREACGIVCLALARADVERLGLRPMVSKNESAHQTAFTDSIEAREGVTTGVSAFDRACTVAAAIDPANGPEAIVSPGHMFPLIAKDGGVLERRGHTEGAVDLARLAGLPPSAVICEIVNADGTMARVPDLAIFAQKHMVKMGTIADLAAFLKAQKKAA